MEGEFQIGDWTVQPSLNSLLNTDTTIHIEPKAMHVLVCLAEHAGEVVTKEHLMHAVWTDTFVGDDALTRVISDLRKAFGDDAKEPRVIQTIPRSGYRLIAPVATIPVVGAEGAGAAPGVTSPGIFSSRRALLFYSLAAMLGAAVIVYAFLFRDSSAARQPEIKSLAVLPLENLSGDPAQEYIADGMTEALIMELSKIGALRVISRTSVMQYKAERKPLPEIARELNVDAVVEGSVVRSGERFRITAQLVRAATDEHLWADVYERDLRDVLSLQSEVARSIAGMIRVTLSPKEESLLANARSVNPEALDAYLMGRDFANRGTDLIGQSQGIEFVKTSIGYFEQAVRIDPEWAMAYEGLACANYLLVATAHSEYRQPTKQAARRALEIDETLAAAHSFLAFVMTFERDWAGAEREYKRAIELNPSYSGAHANYAIHLTFLGRHDEAIREIDLAQELNPLPFILKFTGANLYLMAGQHDRAIEQYRRLLDRQPGNAGIHAWLGEAYILKGMHEQGIAEMRKASELSGDNPRIRAFLAWAYAVSGNRSEALKILDERSNWLSKGGPALKEAIAAAYTALGDMDQAFVWLEKAFQEQSIQLLLLKTDPMFYSLRTDPRYDDLLARIGFPALGS